jgi:hypothetical protein
MRGLLQLIALLALVLECLFAGPSSEHIRAYQELIHTYCFACHNDRAKTGGLTLQSVDLTHVAGHGGTVGEGDRALPGVSRLDFQFDWPNMGVKMVGDITTLSDYVIQRNSIDLLAWELPSRFEKRGIRGHLSVRIHCQSGENDSIRPRLPDPHEFKRYIFDDPNFRQLVADILADRTGNHSAEVNNAGAGLSIIYSPGRWGCSFSYSDIRGPRNIDRNVLSGALKDKKRQIRDSGHDSGNGWTCIVLCDGNCAALTRSKSWDTYSRDDIIKKFFHRHTSPDFIVCLSVHHVQQPLSNDQRSLDFAVELFARNPSQVAEGIERLFETGLFGLEC